MMDFGALLKLKQAWSIFSANHPKVGPFINQVSSKGFCENQEIAIAIRYPDGTEYKTGVRLQESDLQLLNTIKDLAK